MTIQQHTQPGIQDVYLVFKTHLDLGFTDFARTIENGYFTEFIPRAIETARTLRHLGEQYDRPERFVWTTGSWLIYEYLERANTGQRAIMEQAIADGDITWHALPFTTHSELLDRSLFRFGLKLSQRLDKRFGKKTIAAKMTDVPGHTRAIVPLLAEAGVRFLHIGVNDASTPPDVPDMFTWRAPSGEEIIVLYSKGGYGGTFVVPAIGAALAIEHTLDNRHPQSVQDVRHSYLRYRYRFPDATLHASTLDTFAAKLLPIQHTLPVVTEELGDTWIHGVGSDPLKVGQYRELLRLRTQWINEHQRSNPTSTQESSIEENPIFDRFSRQLLLVPEHTWGLDTKLYLADTTHYEQQQLADMSDTPRFQQFAASWQEQRAYIDQAVASLEGTRKATEAMHHLLDLRPQRPHLACNEVHTDTLETNHFQIRLAPRTGALVECIERSTGRHWASPEYPLGLAAYQMFDQSDYDRFGSEYLRLTPEGAWWMTQDYQKPGLAHAAHAHSATVLPQVQATRVNVNVHEIHVISSYTFPAEATTGYGAPGLLTLEWHFPQESAEIGLTLQWFEKPATRLPEALWLTFSPPNVDPYGWEIEKMGEFLSPLHVRTHGARHLHAIDQHVRYTDTMGSIEIASLDAPLLAPGGPALLRMKPAQIDMTRGVSFNLYNNVWGTNFPQWYHDDARLRFILRFPGSSTQGV